MQGGDISNVTAPRLLVTYEALSEEKTDTKKFLGFTTGTTTRRDLNPVALTRIWRYTQRLPVIVELVNFGVDQQEADRRLEQMDRRGTNPVNYSVVYDDVEELIGDLPYRPDVLGVIDVPENQSRYGSRGMGMEHLDRVI